MKKTKLEKGITLVALIITIVVLLILAVVSIGAVRNSGIIGHATNTTSESTVAEEKEIVALAVNEWQLQKNTPNNVEGFKTAIETALNNETENGKVESITGEDAGPLTIIFSKTGNKYTITSDGEISTGGKILGKWSERGLEKVILDTQYLGIISNTFCEIVIKSDGSIEISEDGETITSSNTQTDESINTEKMTVTANGIVCNHCDFTLPDGDVDDMTFSMIFADDGKSLVFLDDYVFTIPDSDCIFTYEGETITGLSMYGIKKVLSGQTEIKIPTEIDGQEITQIAELAFFGYTSDLKNEKIRLFTNNESNYY